MMTLLQTNPELMAIGGDIAAKNMDWPGSFELAERWRKFIKMKFPELIEEDEEEAAEQTPEQMAQMQQAAQAQQMQQIAQEAQMDQLKLELAEQQAKTAQAEANARAAEAKARQAEADAVAAEAKAAQARWEAENAPVMAQHKMRLAERQSYAKGSDRNRSSGSRNNPQKTPKEGLR
jgi:hypothetical protein